MPLTMPSTWSVPADGDVTRAIYEPAELGRDDIVFVCAHGAGGHMQDSRMAMLARALCARGVATVRFNFLYREHGSNRPDPMPRLQSCMRAVVDQVRATLEPRTLVVGGRSMGGRTASMLAADGLACDGLLLFAYPLHAAGKPENLRDAHLARIAVPVLCVNGTRDALCRRDLMEKTIAPLASNWQMHWLDGADHSFHVLKSSGMSDADVLHEAADVSARWLAGLRQSPPRQS